MAPPIHAQTLSSVLHGVMPVTAADDRVVTGLSADSRQLAAGAVFVAIPGIETDGRDFIGAAVEAGAAAVICEARGWQPQTFSVPVYPVADLQGCVGIMADRFFGAPSQHLIVVGITGTNGKTTCAHLTAQALQRLGVECGIIGTLGRGMPDDMTAAALTTPDAVSVHADLAQLVAAGAAFACLEVSSHALDQDRIDGVRFGAAVFTNLSHDHLDYHGDMRRYGCAKARLFEIDGLRHAVINRDDELGAELLNSTTAQTVWSYGQSTGADVYPQQVELDHDGMRLSVHTPLGACRARTGLIGRVNVANVLAVITTLIAFEYDLDAVQHSINGLRPVPGRMEMFHAPNFPNVVVDYAHTPDALYQALTSLREHQPRQLWCVFGCGGDRDRDKRPQMGQIACRYADHVVITDDNPRGEDPAAIVAEIQSGIDRPHRVVHNRVDAIESAIASAAADDIVLVAGKGHESQQTTGDRSIELSDRKVTSAALGLAA